MDAQEALPRWTKHVFTPGTGRDPLGLSPVSQSLTEKLLHGITTLTGRARYYSYYCWALWHIDQHETPADYEAWKAALRRRDSAFALASYLNNPRSSMLGWYVVRREHEAAVKRGEFNTEIKILPSNELGGYGSTYSSPMYELGLTERDEAGIDRITGSTAAELARNVDEGLSPTPYVAKVLYRRPIVPVADLESSIDRLGVDVLAKPFAQAERSSLVDLLLSPKHTPTSVSTLLRSHSLALIINTVQQYTEHGTQVKLDGTRRWALVIAPYYYDQLWAEEEVACSSPSELKTARVLWRQFALQQLLTLALERLLFAVIETAAAEAAGMPVDEIVRGILDGSFTAYLEDRTGSPCKKPCDLLAAFGVNGFPDQQSSMAARHEISLHHRLSEASVEHDEQPKTPQLETAKAVLTLSALYSKWRSEEKDMGRLEIAQSFSSDLCAPVLLPALDSWLAFETDWSSALENLVTHAVIEQHELVKYAKGRLESSWLSRIDGRIRKEQFYSPAYRTSRHHNAVVIMQDLGLLAVDDSRTIRATGEGIDVLKQVLVRSQ